MYRYISEVIDSETLILYRYFHLTVLSQLFSILVVRVRENCGKNSKISQIILILKANYSKLMRHFRYSKRIIRVIQVFWTYNAFSVCYQLFFGSGLISCHGFHKAEIEWVSAYLTTFWGFQFETRNRKRLQIVKDTIYRAF